MSTETKPTATPKDEATLFRERQLARLEEFEKTVGTGPFSDPAALNRALRVARTLGHLLSPVDQVDYVPQMHAVSLRLVALDPYNGRDVYQPSWCAGGEVAPAQIGVLKIWKQASGSDVYSRRLDDRLDSLCQSYQVGVNLRGIDGRDNLTAKTREVDLRDGSPTIEAMRDKNGNPNHKQISQARQNVGSLAETKARLRAIRSALALSQKYTLAELERPFVLPVLVALVDVSDPVIRKLVAIKALGMEQVLYGRPQLGPGVEPQTHAPAGVDQDTGEVHDATIIEDDDPAETNRAAGAPAEDLSDFDEPAAAAPVCSCPCGCRLPVSAAAAALTQERRGAVRCASCFPGARFDPAKHQGLATLGLVPDVTVAEASARRKAS